MSFIKKLHHLVIQRLFIANEAGVDGTFGHCFASSGPSFERINFLRHLVFVECEHHLFQGKDTKNTSVKNERNNSDMNAYIVFEDRTSKSAKRAAPGEDASENTPVRHSAIPWYHEMIFNRVFRQAWCR